MFHFRPWDVGSLSLPPTTVPPVVCVWSAAPMSRCCVVKEVVQVTFSFITCQHLFWVKARRYTKDLHNVVPNNSTALDLLLSKKNSQAFRVLLEVMTSQASAVSSLKYWRGAIFQTPVTYSAAAPSSEPPIMTFSFQLKGEMKPLRHAWLSG